MTSTDSSNSTHVPHVVAVIITDPRIPTSLLGQILYKPIMYNAMVRTCADFARLHGSAADWKRHYQHECTSVGLHADYHNYDWRGLRAAIINVINDVHNRIILKRGGKPLVNITCMYRDVKLVKVRIGKKYTLDLSSNPKLSTFTYEERPDDNRICRIVNHNDTWAFPVFIHKCADFTIGGTNYKTFIDHRIIPSTPYIDPYAYTAFYIYGTGKVWDENLNVAHASRDRQITHALISCGASEEDIARVLASVPKIDAVKWEPKLKWYGLAMEMQELLTTAPIIAPKYPSLHGETEGQSQ